MPRRQRQLRKMRFPKKGIDQGSGFVSQPDDTCVDARNVRSFDPRTGRNRGAQRAGLSRYLNAQAGGTATTIQDINQIVTAQTSVTTAQTSLQNNRYVNVCVADGVVYTFDDTSFTTIAGGPHFDANAPVIFSAQHFGDLYFVDGDTMKYYDESAGTINTWSASAGALPGSAGDRPRLIELWRSRLVLSGVRSDPHNWFMSALGTPADFDYNPSPSVVTQAVAGNNADAGKIGDVVNSMCPYDDDTLIFFCDHSIWQMTGDPAEGGRLDNVSDIIGAAFGRPWCRGPSGEIYFLGSRGGIYRMTVGNKPERLSTSRIEEQIAEINLNTSIVRAIFDDRTQGVHFFITPLTPAATTHIFWDVRNEAFWFDSFTDNNYNPRTVFTIEGDAPSDRAVVMGSDDGYIRKIDYTSKNDDQKAISSYVYIGPIQLDEGKIVQCRGLTAELSLETDEVSYDVFGSSTVQGSFELADDPEDSMDFNDFQLFFSGKWTGGRSIEERRRAKGRSLFVKLYNEEYSQTWSFERMWGFFVSSGDTRKRLQ